jgi:hypothetical protein
VTLRAGSVVDIPRSLVRKGLPNEPGSYVDLAGRRTIGAGVVLDPLPTVPTFFAWSYWDANESIDKVASTTDLVYIVRTWDLDERLVVDVSYPLAILTPLGLLLNMPAPFGSSTVLAYDGDAPPPDLAALFAAERYAR